MNGPVRAFLLLLLACATRAEAASIIIETGQTDLGFVAGAMTGTIQSAENKAAGKEQVGAATFGVAAHFDYSNDWSGFVCPQVAMDAQTKDVLRKGVAGGLLYHLFGGAKKVSHQMYNASVVQRRSFSLALLGQSAYQSYSARDPRGQVDPITGAAVENSVGIDFRKDVGEETSFGLQGSSTVLVMPASIEGLQTSMTQFGIYWRTYL